MSRLIDEGVLGGLAMTVLNIAMVGSDELARSIAKPSDNRDVDTYVHKEGTGEDAKILSIIRPARYPERLPPLLAALSVGKVGLIEVNKVDATLGETLVAFASSGITTGIAIISPMEGEWIDQEQVNALFTQAGLGEWTFAANDAIELRTTLYSMMDDISSELVEIQDETLLVPIDQHFNVKGIGLVAIGYVQRGTIRVHDSLVIIPTNGIGEVKSLQVMDDDVPAAKAGDRVGIALRNTKENSLGKGVLITDKDSADSLMLHSKSTLDLSTSPFQRRTLVEGDVVHASVDLQFVVGRVESTNPLSVSWESPLLIRRDNPPKVLIAQLDSNPRIMGSATLAGV